MIKIKVDITLDEETIQDLKNRCHDCYGVVLTNEIIEKTCQEDLTMAKSLEDWGGNDTDNASQFINAFIWRYLKVIGYNWPMFGDPLHYKQNFYPKFYKACQTKNVKLTWTMDDFDHETGKLN